MGATKTESNKNTFFGVAPVNAFANILAPTEAELAAVANLSEAIKWDGYDFGAEASEQDEDRALTDAAGSATRGYESYGGSVSLFTPKPGDTTSVEGQARALVAKPKTELVVVTRDGLPAGAPFAAGQVFNIYHVITDAKNEQRGDKNRYYSVNLRPKGKVGLNRIVPASTPGAVAVTPATPSVAAGSALQLRSVYQNNDITIGAQYTVADKSVAEVTKHGWLIGKTAGTTTITATYPGSATGSAVTVTVTA